MNLFVSFLLFLTVTEAAPPRSSQYEARPAGAMPCYIGCWTPCERIQCLNGGYCVPPAAATSIAYCHCPSQYTGYRCEQPATPDPCASLQCNHGACQKDRSNQAYCSCYEGYGGARCDTQIVDPCARYECIGGTCTNDRGVARCVCPVGRVGSRCQEDICTMYPCANGGQCVPEGSSRRCICVHPYYGDDCRDVYRPNPCDNVYCAYGQCREGVCECHSGYTGTRCDIPPDPCANLNCNHGTCYEGRCSCEQWYTGPYCDTQIVTSTTPIPVPPVVPSSPLPFLSAITRGPTAPKSGELIDYGRLLSPRAGPIGAILALVAGLLLLPLALAFAARKCTQGACVPTSARKDYIPVLTSNSGGTQTEVLEQRSDRLANAMGETETTRIEQTREVVREYSGMENTGHSSAAMFSVYPTMSSHHEDFVKESHQQQSSSFRPQQHIIEGDYHPPPVADFGYGRIGMTEGFRDTFESWEASGGGGFSMNSMLADGGLQTDYELSNINSVSMTPNGKYCIVGQSQGPPQIWDAINGQLVSSMQGISANCSRVALACNGTLLVGLANDGIDLQSNVLQIWDVNTGKPIQLTHQIKCATFTLSNNSNSLVMAGNQKFGRGISVGILDLQNSELIKEIKSDTNQSFGGTPSFIALTPDEHFAIVGCSAGGATTYVVFDLTTPNDLVQPLTITIDSEPQCSLVLNNDEVVTGARSGQLVLWNILNCQRLYSLNDNGQNPHRDRVTDLKISPERSCFVSTSADGTAKIWDSNTKQLISRLIGHKREITCACISTNQLVATGSRDQTICLWRLQSGQVASTMPVGMTPLDIHMAIQNRTVVAIGEKDSERQLLMLRVVSIQR